MSSVLPTTDMPAVPIIATDKPVLHKEKHVSYWLRCLRSLLPHPYTHNDSNRMTLAFFIVSALDMLGVLHSKTTPEERAAWIDWVYTCQCPTGGFRGFPGADFGERSTPENAVWDPATVPATYFALGALCTLGDDLGRVKRRECLAWLKSTQRREDGSFGELLAENGQIAGGWDSRFGYCALAVRWILRGNLEGDVEGVPDIDADAFAAGIRGCQTYDGGISDQPFHEAHAGFTYCAIGALSFLHRIPAQPQKNAKLNTATDPRSGLADREVTVRWLLARLTTLIDEDDELDPDGPDIDEDEDEEGSQGSRAGTDLASHQDSSSSHASHAPAEVLASTAVPESGFVKIRSMPVTSHTPTTTNTATTAPSNVHAHQSSSLIQRLQDPYFAGFAGRTNKVADTCYAFWIGGALKMLGALQLVNPEPVQHYLLAKVQHLIAGGFGKMPGDPPDIYHSYLALAALSLLHYERIEQHDNEKQDGVREGSGSGAEGIEFPLQRLDASLCMSAAVRRHIEGLSFRNRRGGS